MSADYGVFWSAIGAISGSVASILGALALIYSMFAYRESLMLSHYSELDGMYSNLLQIALDKPYLVTPSSKLNSEQSAEYDIYAFLVWNFLETISDRCAHNKQLDETWSPVLHTEALRHLAWFKDPENFPKFKKSFHDSINELIKDHSPEVININRKAS